MPVSYTHLDVYKRQRPHHVEGLQNAEWILIDYGDIVIHLFLESSRRFYDLESLWADTTIEKFDELL